MSSGQFNSPLFSPQRKGSAAAPRGEMHPGWPSQPGVRACHLSERLKLSPPYPAKVRARYFNPTIILGYTFPLCGWFPWQRPSNNGAKSFHYKPRWSGRNTLYSSRGARRAALGNSVLNSNTGSLQTKRGVSQLLAPYKYSFLSLVI